MGLGGNRKRKQHLLVVDINTLKTILDNVLGVGLGDRRGVNAFGSGRVGGTESRDHDGDASVVVRLLHRSTLGRREDLPGLSLINGAFDHKESKDQDIVTLK